MKKPRPHVSVSLVLIALLVGASLLQTHEPGPDRSLQPNPAGSSHPEASGGRRAAGAPSARLAPSVQAESPSNYVLSPQDHVAVPEGNALAVVEALRAQAESGDAGAALAIHKKLLECFKSRQTLSDAEIDGHLKAGASDHLARNVATRAKNCEGTDSLLSQRGKWLEQAAESGLAEAQLLYAADPASVLGNSAEMLRHPEKVIDYKRRAMGYLARLASEGSIDATMRLAAAYDNGKLTARDPALAYAYYRSVDQRMPGLISHEILDGLRSEIGHSGP